MISISKELILSNSMKFVIKPSKISGQVNVPGSKSHTIRALVFGLLSHGESVIEQWISSDRLPRNLELSTDSDQLYADGADMTRLIIRITDEFGNPLPYANKVVSFELKGDADLIGENPFPLIGGQAALYVKARHQAGTVIVRAHAAGLPSASVSLEIIPIQR